MYTRCSLYIGYATAILCIQRIGNITSCRSSSHFAVALTIGKLSDAAVSRHRRRKLPTTHNKFRIYTVIPILINNINNNNYTTIYKAPVSHRNSVWECSAVIWATDNWSKKNMTTGKLNFGLGLYRQWRRGHVGHVPPTFTSGPSCHVPE